MIPHLNELHAKYQAKGLTVIGVTGEPTSRIEPFAQTKGMKYKLACGVGRDVYNVGSLPHAWLLGPRGTVLWKGHPSSLQEATIQQALTEARVAPALELPASMKKASLYLTHSKLDSAVKELERHAKRPKNDGEDATAKAAIEALTGYGKGLLEKAESHIEAGAFHLALELLDLVETSYKRHALGKQAKDRKAALKKDKTTRTEVEVAKYVLAAEDAAREGKLTMAVAIAGKAAGSKKYADCKMLPVAKKLLTTLQAQAAGKK